MVTGEYAHHRAKGSGRKEVGEPEVFRVSNPFVVVQKDAYQLWQCRWLFVHEYLSRTFTFCEMLVHSRDIVLVLGSELFQCEYSLSLGYSQCDHFPTTTDYIFTLKLVLWKMNQFAVIGMVH